MYTIVVPLDGSEPARRALETAVTLAGRLGDAELRVVNVQPPIPASVGDFVGSEAVHGYYDDEAVKAFDGVRALLKASGLRHSLDYRVGTAGETIADFARETGADHIVMGTRGLGAVKGLLLGSVAIRVAQLAPCPVTLVK
jgi:nucleotide-binding universal stress UspA family protein